MVDHKSQDAGDANAIKINDALWSNIEIMEVIARAFKEIFRKTSRQGNPDKIDSRRTTPNESQGN